MTKLLGIVSLILALALFPPAALALVSNNAIPGDATYPLKRILEEGILKIASLNPTTKAWFSIERTNRRFREATTLLTRGTKAKETLDELVMQTEGVAKEIAKIEDPLKRVELIEKLSQEIQKYDAGLEKVKQEIVQVSEGQQISKPLPTSAGISPSPIPSVPTPAPSPMPQATPSPTPIRVPPPDTGDIDRTRDQLEKIKEKLEKEKQKRGVEKEDHGRWQDKGNKEQHDKKDKQDKQDKNDDGSSKKGTKN